MKVRNRTRERLPGLPQELRDPPVAFAAASLLLPMLIVLLGLAAGQSDVSSPLYSLAALVFVVAFGAFLVTAGLRYRARRVEDERLEGERDRQRRSRRVSAASTNPSRVSEERRAS
jgi:hypothetical protein